MTTAAPSVAYQGTHVPGSSPKWWVLLLTGIAWIVVGILVLDADFDSAVTIGYLVGGYLIALGVMEFVAIGVVEGWRWVHCVFGVLFIIGGVLAFTEPFQTFSLLAALFGFFLVLKGAFDFAIALAQRHESDLWWMLLIAGIVEVILGVWASGYPGRSASLLIVWVGIGALVRGITQFVLAFQVRKFDKRVV